MVTWASRPPQAVNGAPEWPAAFTIRVNTRAHSLGHRPQSIAVRVRRDIAKARAEFGELDFIDWR